MRTGLDIRRCSEGQQTERKRFNERLEEGIWWAGPKYKSLFSTAGMSWPIKTESQSSGQVRGKCRGGMKWE